MAKKTKYAVYYNYNGEMDYEGTTTSPEYWLKKHNIERISESGHVDCELVDIALDLFKTCGYDSDKQEERAMKKHGLDEDTACDLVHDQMCGAIEDESDFLFQELY